MINIIRIRIIKKTKLKFIIIWMIINLNKNMKV